MPFKLKQLFLNFVLFDFCWTFAIESASGGSQDTFKDYFAHIYNPGLIITNFISFFLFCLSVYFFLWFFNKKGNHAWGYLFTLLSIPLIILLRYFLQEVFAPAFLGFHNYDPEATFSSYMNSNKYYAVYYTGFGIVFFYLQNNRYKDKIQHELKLQNRQAELDYLKSQINPHFLFNNLSNIYSLIYSKSDNALPAVDKLSKLLRYMLYEKKEKVPLVEEVIYLESFIDLQKLRYDYELMLDINLFCRDNKIEIAPLLLIPLVENAFKHGVFKDSNNPLIIDLQTTDNEVLFTVKNKTGHHEKDKTSGIGLVNLRRRLELLYANKHKLEITDSGNNFKVQLKIQYK